MTFLDCIWALWKLVRVGDEYGMKVRWNTALGCALDLWEVSMNGKYWAQPLYVKGRWGGDIEIKWLSLLNDTQRKTTAIWGGKGRPDVLLLHQETLSVMKYGTGKLFTCVRWAHFERDLAMILFGNYWVFELTPLSKD